MNQRIYDLGQTFISSRRTLKHMKFVAIKQWPPYHVSILKTILSQTSLFYRRGNWEQKFVSFWDYNRKAIFKIHLKINLKGSGTIYKSNVDIRIGRWNQASNRSGTFSSQAQNGFLSDFMQVSPEEPSETLFMTLAGCPAPSCALPPTLVSFSFTTFVATWFCVLLNNLLPSIRNFYRLSSQQYIPGFSGPVKWMGDTKKKWMQSLQLWVKYLINYFIITDFLCY